MGMSFAYGPTDEQESINTLHKALDLRINFWDTADMYANGENEKLISKFWFRTVTKFLLQPNSDSDLKTEKPVTVVLRERILTVHRNGSKGS
jgi:predicted aldo/keto reductase-like oxidoreductase